MNPVWLLSGFLGDQSHWQPEELEKHLGYSVEWIDWSKEAGENLTETARNLSQKALQTGQRPLLIGYSMGGRVALEAITQFPSVFEQGVLLSTHLGFETQEQRDERIKNDEEWAKLLEKDFDLFWEKWCQQDVLNQNIAHPQLDPKLWSQLLRTHSTGLQRNFRNLLSDSKLPPMLFLAGENDRKFSGMLESIPPQINRLIIPEAGHRLQLDQPLLFAQNTAHFIRTHWEKI